MDKYRGPMKYDELRKYLLNVNDTDNLHTTLKPILWIHMNYEYNSRNWESFGSRSSTDLNQPYLYLTSKSIIEKCSDSFHICIIEDSSFAKLIPDWQIKMETISTPIIENVRTLGLLKLLHIYGGFVVSPAFLCLKNLEKLYETGIHNGRMFVCQTAKPDSFDINMIGAPKQNEMVAETIQKCQILISSDYTAQSVFDKEYSKWFHNAKHKVNIIGGKLVGTRTIDDEPILIDNLLSSEYIRFYDGMYGINIPHKQILERTYYSWYARLSTKQVLESKVILSKYIALGHVDAPGEPTTQMVGYWKVPLDAPVYGLMPSGLGDKVAKFKSMPSRQPIPE